MLMPPISRYVTRHPIVVAPSDRMIHAHDLMRSHAVRHLPVVDAGKLVGLVTDRDLRLVESAAGVNPNEVPVREAMIAPPITVRPADPLDEVVARMLAAKANAVVVVDDVGVEGIFTTVDALAALYAILERATE